MSSYYTTKPEPGADPETEIVAHATPATKSTFTPNYASGPSINHPPAAVVTMEPVDIPMHSQTKQGSKCCGCCCDYRRAVIIVNAVLIVIGIISVIVYSQGSSATQNVDWDDDSLDDVVEDAYRQGAILAGVGLFASFVAIVGASRYNIHMVGFNILYMIASFIALIALTIQAFNTLEEDYNGDEEIRLPIGQFIIQGLFLCLFIYPHVGFIFEVKAGILSAETYPREESSCCCIQE